MTRRAACLPVVLLLSAAVPGCGDAAAVAGPCAALAATCHANQQACVVQGGVAACQACAPGQAVGVDGACAALVGTPLNHDFATFTTRSGEEVLGLCQSWTLDNATELWVNSVELNQHEASHHSNWTFVPDDKFDGPDGVWPCSERKYDQLVAALSGGVLYAQSTQASHEVQRFPNGAAVRIPPYSRIIGDVHLLNASPLPVTGNVSLSVYTLPIDQVKVKLVPFHLTFNALDIPPHSTTRHTADCEVGDTYQVQNSKPWDLKVYYLLPHMHALGSRFFVEGRGGAVDGRSLLDVVGFNSEPHGLAYDPPIDMSGATGFRFGCEWNNPRDASIKWGFGDQEMCETLGFGETSMAFESTISAVEPAGTDGTIQVYSGGCGNLLFDWDQSRPGGPPPKK